MSDYRTTPEAAVDLAQIWHYIAQDSPLAADRFIAGLLTVFETLQGQPRMGRSREDLGIGLRTHPHGNYIIVYRIHHEVVVVVRVIHGARDIRRALDGDGLN